jgi:hypothetical protein
VGHSGESSSGESSLHPVPLLSGSIGAECGVRAPRLVAPPQASLVFQRGACGSLGPASLLLRLMGEAQAPALSSEAVAEREGSEALTGFRELPRFSVQGIAAILVGPHPSAAVRLAEPSDQQAPRWNTRLA